MGGDQGDVPAGEDHVAEQWIGAGRDAVVAGRDNILISVGLGEAGSDHSESSFLHSYRRHIVDHQGELEPPDFTRRRRVPIADIYVSPVIERVPTASAAFPREQDPDTLNLWELSAEIRRSVLIADPGGGKTSAAHVLMHYFASHEEEPVPFLVTLREFAASDPPERSVVDHIAYRLRVFYQCPPPAGLVSRLLRTGGAVVIFDGLDELLDIARRREVTDIIERFCAEFPLNRVLVTSRVIGYDQASLDERQFTCYRIGSFDRQRTEEYVHKWFAREAHDDELVPAEARRAAEAFMAESEEVPELRANPMLLALMCILYHGDRSLPRNRAEVYELCADLLFRKWDKHRNINLNLRAGHLLDRILQHLAAEVFTDLRPPRISATHGRIQALASLPNQDYTPKRARLYVTGNELIRATERFLLDYRFEPAEAHEAAVQFVEFSRGRMWVFSATGTGVTGELVYSFTHRAFLEYFGAAHMAYMCDTPEQLADALRFAIGQNEWEVLAEIAVQLKERTSPAGAVRIYKELLQKNTYRDSWPSAYSATLHFLVRCIRSLAPPADTVRLLTDEVINLMCRPENDGEPFWTSPMPALLTNSDDYHGIVLDQIRSRRRQMLTSFDKTMRAKGQRLAEWLDSNRIVIDE